MKLFRLLLSFVMLALLLATQFVYTCGTLENAAQHNSEQSNPCCSLTNPIIYLQNNFHTVVEGKLYRSAQLSPEDLVAYIEKYGIKTIINLRGTNPHEQWWQDEDAVAKELLHDEKDPTKYHFYNIPMNHDVLTSRKKLQTLLDIYDKAPTPILIHCRRGADRTGEAAALWMLEKENATKEDALQQIGLSFQHFSFVHPAKSYLVYIWPEGEKATRRKWLDEEYSPEYYSILYHYHFDNFVKLLPWPKHVIKTKIMADRVSDDFVINDT